MNLFHRWQASACILALAACSPDRAPEETANAGTPADTAEISPASPAAAPTPDDPAPAATPEPSPSPAAALPPVEPIPPGQPGGLPDDRTPIGEGPITPENAQGAAQVVQRYYAFLESGRPAQAYQLWEPGRAGMTQRQFAASFDKYSEYHAQIGAPGRIEAGAGQRFVTVPVQVYGRMKEGARPFHMRGDVILHRAADIDGATPDQRRWRIRDTNIKPRPSPSEPGRR